MISNKQRSDPRLIRLIDVRLNNVSQLAGFAKRDDLAYFLKEICDWGYRYEPRLAPTYLSITEDELDGKKLLRIYVPESSQVHRCNGRIYDRNEDGDFDITDQTVQVAQLYQRKQTAYSENDEEHIKAEKDFLMMPNRMNVSFTRPRTKLIVVGSKKLFQMVPADRNKQYEEVVDGRRVFRSKGVVLANHFKRWYFHAKEAQKIVEGTALAGAGERLRPGLGFELPLKEQHDT